MAIRIDDYENRLQDLKDQIDQLEIQTFSPEVVARNESTRNTGVQTGDGAATNPYPEWYPVRDFGTLGNLTLEILLNRTDSQIAKMTLNGDVDFAFSLSPPLNKGMWFILDVTIDAIGGYTINLTGNVIPASTTIDNTANARTVLRLTTTDGGTTYYAENLETGGTGGGTTGTFISADLTADQITNLAVGNHVEFDRNTTPTGADGGIVLQTGAGQANGIFELKSGKTYFLSGGVAPFFGAANDVDFVWYDITNAAELGRRARFGDAVLAMNQPKCEISFTPLTDVTVELRLVAAATPANLNGYDSEHTFANIFEFSGKNGADGAPGSGGSVNWKDSVRAKTLVDVPNVATFNVITDGITLIEGDRVLLTEQTTASENGIYDVGVVAAGLAPLTRSSDLDVSSELIASLMVVVEEGQDHKNSMWQLISDNPLTIGVSGQLWQEFGAAVNFPDFGQGEDGKDATGQFVFDGRAGVAAAYLKIWEIIDITGNVPEQNMTNMIYLPTNAANQIGRLLIVGTSNATKGGAFSDNYGATWTSAASLSSNLGYGRMAYAPNMGVNGTLVLIRGIAASTSAAFSMQVSTDRGTSFSNVTLDFSNLGQNFNDVIWSEDDQLFVGLSKFDATHEVYTSTNGSSWTRRVTPAPLTAFAFYSRIVFSPSLGTYYVKQNGTGAASEHITSTDGITWSGPFTNDSQLGLPRRIIWSEGQQKFGACGIGPGNVRVEFSDDFVTWVSQTPVDSDGAMEDIVWCPDLSLWVVIGNHVDGTSSPKIFWATNDALTWANFPIANFRVGASLGVSNARSEIAYAEEFGYFFGINTGFGTSERLFRTAMKLE